MIYLDCAATTPPDPAILQELTRFYQAGIGNPSSSHPAGRRAMQALREAKKWLAGQFTLPEEAVIFCSGGTESINLALKGSLSKPGKLVISGMEHAAVNEAAAWLVSRGWTLRILKHHPETGLVDQDDLSSALEEAPQLVSIQQVNSETGVIQPVAKLGNLIKQKAPLCLFHVDGVQAFGKIPLEIKNIDLYSISGHKFRALPGVGALIRLRDLSLQAQQHGGGQEAGLRSGTENLPGIISLQLAGEKALAGLEDKLEQMHKFLDELLLALRREIPEIKIFHPPAASPYILNLSVPGVMGEILLNALGHRGIMISTGSACNSKKKKLSQALKALGMGDQQIKESFRLSFHPDFLPLDVGRSVEEIAACIQELKGI